MPLTDRARQIIETLSTCENIDDAESYYKELRRLEQSFNGDHAKLSLVQILSIIGNTERFLILDALREKDRCVCELEAILNKSQSTVSHHLKELEKVHLVQGWKKGKFTHYSLVQPKFQEILAQFTEWVEGISNWSMSLPGINRVA